MTDQPAQTSPLHLRVAEMAVAASDGSLPLDGVVAGAATFADFGMSSLSFLRLIDSLENEFGIYVDLEEAAGTLTTVDGLLRYMDSQGIDVHAG
ncbi:acyl carrier protein [Kitasatospora phosalacinea]|uniref:Acyl carrier protein n=1 Tax=Kitasatospora phosalacinea TaxID=2065 RepID=A0ABW6GG99_9ACTN